MGGLPPLGYDVRDRKLVVNEAEAKTVRQVFQRYLVLGSIRLLKQELDTAGVVSKRRTYADGSPWGGVPLNRGALYLMLHNRVYLGEIGHKGKHYPGEHHAIIEPDFWQQVQEKLNGNRVERVNGGGAVSPSLLAELLHDDRGEPMTPSHAVSRGTRYRYYVSRSLIAGVRRVAPGARRLPAADIEGLVATRLCGLLSDPAALLNAVSRHGDGAAQQKALIDAAARLAGRWGGLQSAQQRAILAAFVARIEIGIDRVDIHLLRDRLASVDRLNAGCLEEPAHDKAPDIFVLSVPARLRRAGIELKLVVDGQPSAEPDAGLIKLLQQAQDLYKLLMSGEVRSAQEIGRRKGLTSSFVTRVLRIAFLAPDIVAAIFDGKHPPELNAAKLLRDSRLPLDWRHQRNSLGFG